MNRYAIVLAAGKGTRMHSLDPNHSKVSYPILGKPIVNYVLDTLKELNFNKITVVVGFGGDVTKKLVDVLEMSFLDSNIALDTRKNGICAFRLLPILFIMFLCLISVDFFCYVSRCVCYCIPTCFTYIAYAFAFWVYFCLFFV